MIVLTLTLRDLHITNIQQQNVVTVVQHIHIQFWDLSLAKMKAMLLDTRLLLVHLTTQHPLALLIVQERYLAQLVRQLITTLMPLQLQI